MEKNFYFQIFIGFFLFCSYSCLHLQDDPEVMDYESIESIEIELILEIDKDEKSSFLPGLLGELIRMENGDLLVSDLGKVTIEHFNSAGKHLATISEEGRGPGELTSFYSLIKGSENTLLVKHRGMYRHIDFFESVSNSSDYRFIKTAMPESFENATVHYLGALSDTTYLAQIEEKKLPPSQFLLDDQEVILSKIVIVDSFENILEDSLHTLVTPAPVFWKEGGMIQFANPSPYQYRDHAKTISGQKYFIAQPKPDNISVTIYQNNSITQKQIEIPVKPQIVNDKELENNLNEVNNRDARNKLISRVGRYKPSFLDIWISENYLWLHTDTFEEKKQIAITTLDGEPVGSFYLSVYDDVQYVLDHKLFTLYKSPDEGHTIRLYQINGAGNSDD